MYSLLVYAVLPWIVRSASPKSDEFAAKQRKDTSTRAFGVGRFSKLAEKEAAPSSASEPERHVRATFEVTSSGNTKQVEETQVPPAIRTEAAIPADQMTPGIPVMTENDAQLAEVPKVIHFMFKKDLTLPNSQWPNPVWKASFASWQRHFPEPEYMYRFWTDSTIDRFFKESCKEHYALFTTYTKEIYKSDLSRYCILKEIGGIYADLDYEPRMNFYNDLRPGKVSLIGSPYFNEEYQNALMASPSGEKWRKYWNGLFELAEAKRQFNEGPVEATGPKLLDSYSLNMDDKVVNKLPCHQFQLKVHYDDKPIKKSCGYLTIEGARKAKGIHWGTVSWAGRKGGQLQSDLEGENNHGDTARLFRMLHPEVPESELH